MEQHTLYILLLNIACYGVQIFKAPQVKSLQEIWIFIITPLIFLSFLHFVFIFNKKILTQHECILVTSFQSIIIICIIKFTYISFWGWFVYTFMMMSLLTPIPPPRTNNISS